MMSLGPSVRANNQFVGARSTFKQGERPQNTQKIADHAVRRHTNAREDDGGRNDDDDDGGGGGDDCGGDYRNQLKTSVNHIDYILNIIAASVLRRANSTPQLANAAIVNEPAAVPTCGAYNQ